MTRVAIVASSAQLRASLARALRASPAFEVVQLASHDGEISAAAEVVLVAQPGEESGPVSEPNRGESPGGGNLTAREHEILVRAWDSSAATQPEDEAALWNPKGYANNSWARLRLIVR